jgi:hypothetical protein
MEIASFDFVRRGLAVGRGHLQLQIGSDDNEVGAYMRVHGRRRAGSENILVGAHARIFRGNGCCRAGGRLLGAMKRFHI